MVCSLHVPLRGIQGAGHTSMPIIALLTDFGLADHFVGSVKAAILSVNPRAAVVDITHAVAPGDIEAGAFTLLKSYRDFPPDTVFAAVVDPGVGTGRDPIAVRCGTRCFVGPDNGLLGLACARAGRAVIRVLDNPRYFREPVSRTFHGRDIFGPVAAHLSRGVAFEKLGPITSAMVPSSLPPAQSLPGGAAGVVAAIDRFGNCITTIEAGLLSPVLKRQLSVWLGKRKSMPFCTTYGDVAEGKPMGLVGSTGFVEIAVNRGNAAGQLKLRRGDAVTVTIK